MCSLMFSSTVAYAAMDSKSNSVLSYREWKTQTRQEIQKKIHFIEQKLAARKTIKNSTFDDLDSQLRSEKNRLEASEDLSFHEYFLSYFTEQKNIELKISELAKTLKPDEIKELIGSYATFIKQKKVESGKQGYATDPLED